MSMEFHQEAEQLALRAEGLLRAGELTDAREVYFTAGEVELQAYRATSFDASRTKGILAVSAISLLYKSGNLEFAETVALGMLTEFSLPDFARDQIRETLGIIWEEQSLRLSGQQFADQTITVSMRGREVGTGSAPVGLVVDRVLGIHSLLYRITEWLGDFPFRTRGMPPEGVREICQPWVSEPQPGSYRFSIRLVESSQLELIRSRPVVASEVSASLIRILRSIASPELDHSEIIEEVVPDERYREVILKLIRNMAPDGRRLREMEFTSGSRTVESGRVVLEANVRFRVSDALQRGLSAVPDIINGTLRAVHLDRNWLEVVDQEGNVHHCGISHETLDEVVGPMLNRRVIVHGRWNPLRTRFRLYDIELDQGDEG
jgi:hypothetical protein